MSIDWQAIAGVREHRHRAAQREAMQRREELHAHEAQADDAERERRRLLAMRQQHDATVRDDVRHGGRVADLRQGSGWDRVLAARIERQQTALADARAEAARRRGALDAALQRLQRASAAMEQARGRHADAQARVRRARAMRQDDAADDAALGTWRTNVWR